MNRAELEALSTEELRHKAFDVAQDRRDVGFFWDLLKHLPAASELASNDSFTAAPAAVSDLMELIREFRGEHLAEAEPMVRAKFIEYLEQHPDDDD
jgi:hypothetical protein